MAFVYEHCDTTQEFPSLRDDVVCFICDAPVQAREIVKICGITPQDLNPNEVSLYAAGMAHLAYEWDDEIDIPA